MVVAADEETHHFVAFTARSGLAPRSPARCLEVAHGHALEVTAAGEHHHRAFVGNEVDILQPPVHLKNLAAPTGCEAGTKLREFAANHRVDPFTTLQDVLVVGNLLHELLVLQPDLVGFEGCQAPQLHLQNRVRLQLAQGKRGHERGTGARRIGSGTDQPDHGVQIGKRKEQTLKNVVALFRFPQQETRAAFNGFDAEAVKHLQHPAQGEQLGLPVYERHHVGAEVGLQRREFEEVVQNHLGVGVAPQLDHDPHAVPIALVANIGDAFELLVVDEFGNALNECRLVGLIGQFRDDHGIAIGPSPGLHRFDGRNAAHGNGAPPREIGFDDAAAPQDLPTGGEVGAGNELHELLITQLRIGDERIEAVYQLSQVVRWDVGGHAHGDAGRAVEQQLGDASRHHRWFLLRPVEIVDEIDGFTFDVLQQAVAGERFEPRLGVPHGGGRIVVNGSEVAVPVDERGPHGEILGHAHHGVVNRRIAVGVVLAEHFPHHACAFAKRPLGREPEFVHGVKDAPMHRLEAVAGVGQGPAHNHAHGVLQVRA